MWIRFFLVTSLPNARQLFREHLANFVNMPGLIDRVRDCMPSDRARLLYDLLVVELALEWHFSIGVEYIDRASDVSTLIVNYKEHDARS